MIGDFHFIRPWWLAALVPLALLVWAIYRRQNAAQAWRRIIAPHLLSHLVTGRNERRRISPLLLIAIGWLLTTIAVAGPTWRREPSPFADDTAALAIVIKVSPSMSAEDVAPTRLARAVQKIHDLLGKRAGAKTALIAYAGSAHRVVPLTTDGGIIETFAQALDPKIMPADGDAAADALRQADAALGGSGSILWITDGVAPEQGSALSAWRKHSSTAVWLLPPLPAGAELDAVSGTARAAKARVVQLAADDSDVDVIARDAKFASVAASAEHDRWQESGFWLTPLLALLMLPFFRQGWMVATAARG
jgi:Ca-activated chloride channel family protein